MANPIQVLIVDDDVVWRDVLRSSLNGLPDIAVGSVSPTAKLGLERVRQSKPDLVLLDAGIADMTAVQFTRRSRIESPDTGVILTSDQTPDSAEKAIQALGEGAFDFVLKPGAADDLAPSALRRALTPKIRSFSIRRYSRMASSMNRPTAGGSMAIRPLGASASDAPAPVPTAEPDMTQTAVLVKVIRENREQKLEVVLIGVSTGGPEALRVLLGGLPATFPLPIAVVLHMPKVFTGRMASELDRQCAITVREATDGEELRAGVAYLAPGGQHLELRSGTRRRILAHASDAPPENGCRPSADVLFRSAAEALRGRALAVLMTGMGDDGVRGLRELKKHNAPVLVQDEASSVVWGMPGSAVRAGLADGVVPLERMAHRILRVVRGDTE